MLFEFNRSLDRVSARLMKGKVDGNAFSLNTNIIANHLDVLEEGDTTYFDNFPNPSFLKIHLLEDKMVGTILKEGIRLKNSVKAKDLTRMVLIFWQIMARNIWPQVGHLNEVGNFRLYIVSHSSND